MKTNSKLLTATIGLGMLLAAPLAMANDPAKKGGTMAQDRTHAANHDSNEPVTDTWITTKVKADLLATENVSGLDIKVETVDGVVTLTGAVTSQAQKDKAVEVAKQIKGVKRVEAGGLKLASR